MIAGKQSRRKPYTEIGIRRVLCAHCGAPSVHQWKICALGEWMGACRRCDMEINRMVAIIMVGRQVAYLFLRDYEARATSR